jgi:Protein of unknown function (DUF1236)
MRRLLIALAALTALCAGAAHAASQLPAASGGAAANQPNSSPLDPRKALPTAPSAGDGDRSEAPQPGLISGPLSATGAANLSDADRAQLQSWIIAQPSSAAPDANLDLNVGASVPRTVTLYDMPADVGMIAPAYKGLKFARSDNGTIIVVDPASYMVVDVIKG